MSEGGSAVQRVNPIVQSCPWASAGSALSSTPVVLPYAPGFRDFVLHKQVLVPSDLQAMFDLPDGHMHHGELSIDQIFLRRPIAHYADYRSPIAGLYQCGASTHPGNGVTGVPGHNAAQVILSEI